MRPKRVPGSAFRVESEKPDPHEQMAMHTFFVGRYAYLYDIL